MERDAAEGIESAATLLGLAERAGFAARMEIKQQAA